MKKSIGIWSADYSQLTGQALVTARVRRCQPNVSWREYVYRGGGWRSIWTWAGAVFRLWVDLTLGRLDVLYLVCSRSNGGFIRDVPALLATRTRLRVVVHVHGSDIVQLLSSRTTSPLALWLYRPCEIIVPSTHLVQPIENITGRRPHLCENYLGDDASSKPYSNIGDDPNLFTVLWNSNIMASKGFFDLTKAVRQLREEGYRIRLISLGQPIGDEEMSKQRAAHQLDELRIFEWLDYRGKVDQATGIALTAEADVICLPSRYSSESQGIAIIEGMCAGKAIVASDIPALRATLRGYPAHFVPVHSVPAIVAALRDLQHLKQADPIAFAISRQQQAADARERFAATRFDREMATILQETEA